MTTSPLDPSTLLQGIAATALTQILPNLQAIDLSVKAINANPTLVNTQTQLNNIVAQGVAIELDAPVLLPVIEQQAIAAVSSQADTTLEQLIAWIEAQATPVTTAPATPAPSTGTATVAAVSTPTA
jgi:hypothetical protein